MKKVWKWIIGIVLGLIILAVLCGVGFMLRGNFHGYRTEAFDSRGYSERGPGMMPYGGFDSHMRGSEMMPYGGFSSHMRGPGMQGYGLMPFAGFVAGLVSLGFLALVVLGIIWLVRSLRTPKSVEASAAIPAVVVNPCKRCGNPLQDGWNNCPNCGKKV
jgi:hypothetical protein